MKQLIIKDGKLVVDLPTLEEIRAYVQDQLANEIWPEEQRFENPHRHYLDMSPSYYQLKMDLLNRIYRKNRRGYVRKSTIYKECPYSMD